jgi:hypothetical protein
VADLLVDDLDQYRQLISAQTSVDPLVYQELVSFYVEEPFNPQIFQLLETAMQARDYFAPDLLLYAGRICREQQQFDLALTYLEQAIQQLQALGFSEAQGDFSREELDELRTPHQPEPKHETPKPKKSPRGMVANDSDSSK